MNKPLIVGGGFPDDWRLCNGTSDKYSGIDSASGVVPWNWRAVSPSGAREGELSDDRLWGNPAVKGTYYALYPRAWHAYDTAPVKVTIEQFSPIIPNDYRETS